LAGVNVDNINDDYFKKSKAKKPAKSENQFFADNKAEKSEEEKKRLAAKKET